MFIKNITPKRVKLILIGLMAALLLAALDSTIVGTAMKKIIEDLHGIEQYAWPFTIYMLCSTAAIPVFGGLADIFGRKPIFLLGILIFLTGSALCGTSQNMTQLIIYRGFQGIGGGILVSNVFAIVADLFPPEKRGKYTGIVTSMYGLASVIGPLIGGFITDNLNWRWIFYVNIPIGIAAGIIIFFALPNFGHSDIKKSIDLKGIFIFILAVTPLLLALSWAGKDYPWLSVQIVCLFAFSAVMFLLFGFIEKKSSNPIIPLSLFKNRTINISVIIAFLTNALMFAAIMFIPYFVQGVIGSNATTSGAITTPMMLSLMVASTTIGITISKVGKYKIVSLSSFIIITSGMVLLSTIAVSTHYYSIVIFMIILGFGIGMAMPVPNVAAQNSVPQNQIGTITSVVTFFRNVGATIGSAVYGSIMTNSLSSGLSNLDLSNVPDKVTVLLKNPQIITDSGALRQIKSNVPTAFSGFFDKIMDQIKVVLSNSIHNVFFICIFIAISGIITAFMLKEFHKTKLPALSDIGKSENT
ncbi:MAG: MDR family MFS transporter [Bacillota bacterium]|nr:MDR family MFS transporter [Bacillota bacterium]